MQRRDFLNTCVGSLVGMDAYFSSKKRAAFHEVQRKAEEETQVSVLALGTAQDGGIPHFGCYCKNCRRARKNPRYSRLISSLALFDHLEKKFFLLDATPDLRVQNDLVHEILHPRDMESKFKPDGILLTHAHIGHYTGMIFFGYEAMSTYRLPVYCSARMKAFLTANGPWSQLVSLENISCRVLTLGQSRSLTSKIAISAFQVPHRDEFTDTLGFIVSGEKRKLLYIPDIQNWEVWNRSIVEETGKVDIALLDGTFYGPEELPGRDISQIGHPLISKSMRILRDVVKRGKTKIYFTHLNHSNLALDPGGEAEKRVREEGFHLASDGMSFYI